jgi:hypothetical protein
MFVLGWTWESHISDIHSGSAGLESRPILAVVYHGFPQPIYENVVLLPEIKQPTFPYK